MVINNDLLAKIAKVCCSWGYKLRLRDSNGEFVGNTSPILNNAHPNMLWMFASFNLFILFINALLFVLSIFFASQESQSEFRSMYISAIIFSALNSFIFMYFANIKFASDEEWSRILVFMLADFGGQVTYITISLLRMVKLQEEINLITVCVAICLLLSTFLSLSTLFIILRIAKSYLLNPSKFQASVDAPNLRPVEFLDIY